MGRNFLPAGKGRGFSLIFDDHFFRGADRSLMTGISDKNSGVPVLCSVLQVRAQKVVFPSDSSDERSIGGAPLFCRLFDSAGHPVLYDRSQSVILDWG